MTPTKALHEAQIRDWKPVTDGSKGLLGFFSVVLPSGMIIHDLRLYQGEKHTWISYPVKKGEVKFFPIIDFVNRETQNRFEQQILAALDKQHIVPARA